MSAKFARLCLMMPQKVMIHGVTRPSMRGVPAVVKQVEVTSKVQLAKVRNTVKVAVLKGDSVCNNLVCVSLYDSKPIYLLSNACTEVKWVQITDLLNYHIYTRVAKAQNLHIALP